MTPSMTALTVFPLVSCGHDFLHNQQAKALLLKITLFSAWAGLRMVAVPLAFVMNFQCNFQHVETYHAACR